MQKNTDFNGVNTLGKIGYMRPTVKISGYRIKELGVNPPNTSKNRILKSVKRTKNQDKRILKFDCNRIFKSVLQIRQTEFWWLTGTSIGRSLVSSMVY